MELSAGRADGLDGWEVPANDLGYVWIAPPDTFAGSVDVIAELRGPDGKVADRQIITLDWTLPNAPALGHIAESSTLTSVSLKPVQLRDDQNDRTGAALLEQENISQRASGEDEIEPASPISLEPIQLQPDREAVRPEAPIPPLDARWKEIDTASPTLLQVVQLRPDSKEIMPAELPEPRRQKQPNSEELAVLLKRGKDFIATGDLAAARLVLRKAAEANNAEAALALGATYDPLVLRQLKVYGFTSDAAMARSWYEKAAELGSSAASRRLEMLTEVMGTR
jgi:TPR repeat protein